MPDGIRTQTRQRALLLGVITAWAFLLRVHGIGGESATGDEVFALELLDSPTLSDFLTRSSSFDPTARLAPLYGIAVYGWAALFGPGMVAARLFSVFCGTACVPLLYCVGRRLFGERAAWLSSALLATATVHIYYGQETRFYALLSLLSLLSMAAFLRAEQEGGRFFWGVNLAANAAMLWTHSFSPMFYLLQGAYLLLNRDRRWRRIAVWAAVHGTILVLFAVWLRILDYDPGTESLVYFDRPPGWKELASALVVFAGGRFSKENPAPYMPGYLSFDLVVGALFLLAAGVVVLHAFRRDGDESQADRRNTLFVFVWLFGPILLLFFVSKAWRMLFYPRYILYSSFPVYLLLARGCVGVPTRAWRRGLCGVLLCMGAYQALAIPRPWRPGYDRAAIDCRRDPEAAVLVLKPFNARAMAYVLGAERGRMVEYWGFRELCEAAGTEAAKDRPVWAVFYQWDNTNAFQAAMEARGLDATRHEYGGLPLLICYRVRLPEPDRGSLDTSGRGLQNQ